MKNITNRFSFILKSSPVVKGGVGVFALHDIAEGTDMELFLPDFQEELHEKDEIPEELRGYCIDQEGGRILCPKFFNRMDIGNYLNHSAEKANVRYEKGRRYFAVRDIQNGEEILANYQQLGEPKDTWDDYYLK